MAEVSPEFLTICAMVVPAMPCAANRVRALSRIFSRRPSLFLAGGRPWCEYDGFVLSIATNELFSGKYYLRERFPALQTVAGYYNKICKDFCLKSSSINSSRHYLKMKA